MLKALPALLRRATFCHALATAVVLSATGATETNAPRPENTRGATLPILTTASAVAQLKRDQAQRGYPVRIRGVVTCIVTQHQAFVLQDTTRGVFVRDDTSLPQAGELWQVEGVTDKGSFAPIVKARRKIFLGLGNLPAAVQPDWDQLINGSLDDQLVEIRGVIESTYYDPGGWSYVILRTQGGSLRVDLPGSDITPDDLARWEKNVVRIQGCFFAKTDTATWQVVVGQVRIFGAKVTLEQPGLADLFSIPAKTAAELMLFDPSASAFQRVKVLGQIIHVRGNEYFMMDATNGVRFIAAPDRALRPGDLVEVVGFPRLSRAAPALTEAVVRKTGHDTLPEPKRLKNEDLTSPVHDSTLVRVEGLLASIRQTPTNLVMEMQSGSWRFLARLNAKKDSVPPLRIGSTLDLTGTYCAQGGYKGLGEDVAAVDLLLNSPSDIKVLATASWWTLQRLLVVVGVLMFILVGAILWITQLRRQVEQRSAELEAQIREREQVEHQHAMEQERARIAQDLHDELGSGLTEIGMLAARTKSASATIEKRHEHLERMNDKAHEMVTALDEIVWAMNPAHNSVTSLVSYFSLHADRFLGLAGITWRLENSANLPDRTLNSHDRHQLFRAYKEALTNVVRHSRATEVRVGIQVVQNELRVTVTDNGRGLPPTVCGAESNGVAGMRARIEKLGGRFELTTEAGRGTRVSFTVPTN